MSWLQSLSRRSVISFLETLENGQIDYADARSGGLFGTPDPDMAPVQWTVQDRRFFSQLAGSGSLGFAESWMQGHWQTDDLTGLLRILYRNLSSRIPGASRLPGLSRMLQWFAVRFNRNTRSRSRRQIAAHYDLSNEFFELFLDPTMMYSSGWFESPESTLYDASVAKLDRICQMLQIRPGNDVLEIGTGWGGFALHAAARHNCRLTTTTISAAQFDRARQRFQEAGVTDRVQLQNADYRDLQGQYDRVVSIEMIEAVGERDLDTYFRKCSELLRPGGRLVLQAIVMPEDRYATYRRSTDFIQQYIFPGGFLPSVTAMQQSIGRTSDLRLHALDDLSEHYARTLQEWRTRFLSQLSQVRALGFDERFIRMWEYYLCYCEAAFREQAVRVVQIAWDKPPAARR